MTNSKTLTGRPLPREGSAKARNMSTSAAVKTTPAQSGNFGKMRQSPIAEPRSSARSVDMIAISEST